MNGKGPDVPEASSPARRPDTASVQAMLEEALGLHQTGRLAESERLYRMILAVEPRHAEALHLLGVLAYQLGSSEAAAGLIGEAIAIDGTVARYHLNLGNALHDLRRFEGALAAFATAIRLSPDYAAAHYNLGNALRALGRPEPAVAAYRRAILAQPAFAEAFAELGGALMDLGQSEEALAAYDEAIRIRPDLPGTHYNLGIALRALGRIDEAAAAYRSAIGCNPHFAEAHCNLGNALKDLGHIEEAVAAYRTAAGIKPDFANAHSNLAIALNEMGQPGEALVSATRALRIEETSAAKLLVAKCLKHLEPSELSQEATELLLRALSEPWVRPDELSAVALRQIRNDPVVRGLLARLDRQGWDWEAADELLHSLAARPVLVGLLQNAVVADADLERLLTNCRRCCLMLALRSRSADWLSGQAIDFLSALARQCFINEYAFACAEEEAAGLEQLNAKLVSSLSRGARAEPGELLISACYVPLGSLPGADAQLSFSWIPPVQAVLQMQIVEPLEEQRLRTAIPQLTSTDAGISRLVRAQYEENPYPRWMKIAPATPQPSFDQYLRAQLPRAPYRPLRKSDPDILVAGCGTGQHPIEIAQIFPGASVLAIDLSLASLAYAQRKARALGLQNLQFGQADILRLNEIGRSFDVIESVGVLHHLADPEVGLAMLVPLLRPGGLMKLGLYSARARRAIAELRRFIAARGYGTRAEDIRRCRRELLAGESPDVPQTLLRSADFGSISGCRDLLFNVQEHVLTLPEIAEWLSRYRLIFLGFGLEAEIGAAFRERFPAPAAETDLHLWDEFERENPDSFMGMYQFWVQKA